MDCFAALAMTEDDIVIERRVPHRAAMEPWPRKTFFIIFVDAIFTTLFQRLFTNAFDVIRANTAIPCVYRACHAD
jgi:hypothetical protein